MGLSWQQGRWCGTQRNIHCGKPDARARALPSSPCARRMSVELGGSTVARSDGALLLFEPARYPVAYFPLDDVADGGGSSRSTAAPTHADLGETRWFDVAGGGRPRSRGALPGSTPSRPRRQQRCATPSRSHGVGMDAFYEEGERILGHAADPYHRIDIRRSSRHLVVQRGDQVIAETHSPVVLYESGFAPRWYVPRADVVADALGLVEGQTFCPYKGIASYYDVGDSRNAAWSYRAPIEGMARIADLVSFEPDKVTITIERRAARPRPGPDRQRPWTRPQPQCR